MSFISNLFNKKDVVKVATNIAQSIDTTAVKKQLIKEPVEVTLNGGQLPEITVIGKNIPSYYNNLFVILDNGHGEDTPGKCSPDRRLREYSYTRIIVQMISEELKKFNIPHHILVPEENDIPLKERVIRANKIHAEQHKNGKLVILISVHCNAAGNGGWKNARGWSAWTSVGTNESDIVADCLYKAAHEILDPKNIKVREDKQDGDADWESNFYIIYKSSMPSVLVENFFQDNKQDVDYLLSPEGKRDITMIHVNGILKYADLKLKR